MERLFARGSAKKAKPAGPAPSPAAASRRIEGWEAAIGGSWLNRIGVALLVIGIAFALGYSMTVLGPAGKAAVATAVSAGLLALGVVLERRETYRVYGRGLIGGGWAALYATAYAVHGLDATRVVESPFVGFVLLMAVGAGMILHSLRYDNQGLTGIAYALAYGAIVLHSIGAYTLAAAALLGAGTVAHLLRRRWYGAAFGGLLATYGCLFHWYLRQDSLTLDTLKLGLGALAVDWIVFLAPDFGRRPAGESERRDAAAVALLNALSAAGLAFLAWSRTFPESAWQPLAAMGIVYAVTSAALRRTGRLAVHPVHSAAAAVLVALAAWKGLSLTAATWVWLAEAQAIVILGMVLKDQFHRFLGSLLFLLPALAIVHEQRDARVRLPDGAFQPTALLLTAAACACFYVTFSRLAAYTKEGEGGRAEEILRRAFSYGAMALILLALWVQLPAVWVAPAAAALMVLLFEISAARGVADFRIQTYAAGIAALVSALALSAPSRDAVLGFQARVPALDLVAAALLAVFMRSRGGRARVLRDEDDVRASFPWTAAALAALSIWLAARPVAVGPAWTILALLLVEAGMALGESHLRRPGYAILAAACVSLVASNLTATDVVAGISVRALTLVPCLAALYYLWWRLRAAGGDPEFLAAHPGEEVFGRVLSYAAAGLLGLFVRFEFGLDNAALRWALAVPALLAAGYLLRDGDLRIQAYALAGAVLFRAAGFDFRQGSPFLGMDGPLAVALAGTAALAGAGGLVRRRAGAAAAEGARNRRRLALEARIEPHGADLLWLLATALAALYAHRTWSGFALIVAWAIQGLAATAAGFLVRSQPLRIAGLALLGLGLAMTLYRTFTEFDTAGRIISFIVLGVILLLVSFGYTRYRDALRRAP
jgi:uncharacterized membrane protein